MIQTCELSYPPLLPGIRSENDGCGHTTVLLTEETPQTAIHDLVAGLPVDRALLYFDREHDGIAGLGAYVVAYWTATGLVHFYANHGWTSEATPIDPEVLAEDLYRCRSFNSHPEVYECMMILPHHQRTRLLTVPPVLKQRGTGGPWLPNAEGAT